ncbi:MAG: hypothetical protein AAFX94_07980 [Myxococcota bacterium]
MKNAIAQPIALSKLNATALTLLLLAAGGACSEDESDAASQACDTEPVLLQTAEGVEFVQTPDACFENLTGWPYEPQYEEIDGLRQAYVDEGRKTGMSSF